MPHALSQLIIIKAFSTLNTYLRSVDMIESHFFNLLSYASTYNFTSFNKNLEKNTKKIRETYVQKLGHFLTFCWLSHFNYIDNKLRKKTSKDVQGTNIYSSKNHNFLAF